MLPTGGRTHLGDNDQGGAERTASNGEQPAAGLEFGRSRRDTSLSRARPPRPPRRRESGRP
eukprot:3372112-Prymnesium_polylepis.1